MTSPATFSAISNVIGGPVPDESRQGRLRQRYDASGARLVAGCIPVRFSGCVQSYQHVQVCMVTSTSGNGLVFPKGGWEDDESVESAAQRETVEEAGVRGVLEDSPLGVFLFASGKHVAGSAGSDGSDGAPGGRCKAYMFVMHVAEELPSWPESRDRQRIWCSISEASRRCKHPWMREALHAWVRRNGWQVLLLEAGATANGGAAAAVGATANGHAAVAVPVVPVAVEAGGQVVSEPLVGGLAAGSVVGLQQQQQQLQE
ncbi:hypothetical protein Agub_g15042 [Astrephomene gubernaculifera]|uniref:Nudix hydrolase domain-containing protein n=1 Tax=Astrephomene gubernaculifera TaxID=47775 RepID=A0AAD3HTE7_9CHLO|nr:hypothetical protein Agub_g15042 [Astrephomene gubernaculifera]